jgi:hypothetical protein
VRAWISGGISFPPHFRRISAAFPPHFRRISRMKTFEKSAQLV